MFRFQKFSVWNSTDEESSSLNIDYFEAKFLICGVKYRSDKCHNCPAHALRESSYELQLTSEIEAYAISFIYFKMARVETIY